MEPAGTVRRAGRYTNEVHWPDYRDQMPHHRLAIITTLAISTALVAACGDNDGSAESTQQTEPTDGTIGSELNEDEVVDSASQDVVAQPEAGGLGVGPYNFHLTTPDGWEYDVSLEWSPSPVAALADVSNSPPGKAQLHLTSDMVNYSYTGTLTGRNAPPLEIVDIKYVWSQQGPNRFDEADQCRRHTDAELGLAVGDQMAVWCETLAFAAGSADRATAAAASSAWLVSTTEGPEADVFAWQDYFVANPSPDFVTVMFAGPCTVAVDGDGGASLLTGDSVYSPIRNAVEGCAASGELGPAALNPGGTTSDSADPPDTTVANTEPTSSTASSDGLVFAALTSALEGAGEGSVVAENFKAEFPDCAGGPSGGLILSATKYDAPGTDGGPSWVIDHVFDSSSDATEHVAAIQQMVQNCNDLSDTQVDGALVAYNDTTNDVTISWFGDGNERLVQVSGDAAALVDWIAP